jgi:hypothetical protein
MSLNSSHETNFILEVYRLTKGDPAAQVSTTDIGAAIGLEKAEAGKLSETLIGQGWVEIKTLSGGIGITAEGIEAARAAGGGPAPGDSPPSLGTAPILDATGRRTVESLLSDVRAHLGASQATYDNLEEIVIDIKTMETQLLSRKPKTAIAREVIRSMQSSLERSGAQQVARRLGAVLGG